jgi:UDP-N-acetylglucosamine acyltransferase
MGVTIHPTAIVSPGAELGEQVVVEAFALIGPKAQIGDDSIIRHHSTVEGDVFMGKGNEVYPYAMIGGLTHDLKYQGGTPKLKIGDKNVFREYVTAHVATDAEDFTIIGSDNVFLAYSHVAHDCTVGDHLVMSSHSALGGHVKVEDYVNIGWGAGVHQFCRLGRHSMVSACSKLVQDVPPYMLADGSPAEVRSINKVGMDRFGYTGDDIEKVRKIFKTLYKSDLNRTQAIKQLNMLGNVDGNPFIEEVTSFICESERGLA